MKRNLMLSNFVGALGALVGVLIAGQGQAVVTVNNSSTTSGTITVGTEFQVAVRLTWDGAGALQGVFSSTQWDPNVLEFVSRTNFPGSILAFVDPDTQEIIPGLGRLGGDTQPGDPAGLLRTVQYGGLSAVDPRAATTGAGRLITTITLRAKAAGSTSVAVVVANGDSGATGDTFTVGTSVPITVPEPGEVMLGLAALGSVGGLVAVRRRI